MSGSKKDDEMIEGRCVDCGTICTMRRSVIEAGSKNRDPGEIICRSCNASRTVLIRKLMKLPDTLHQIKATRMVR